MECELERRDLFQRGFRQKGTIHLTTTRGREYVDIKVNGAVHKGMPHKFYPRAIGVKMNKHVSY